MVAYIFGAHLYKRSLSSTVHWCFTQITFILSKSWINESAGIGQKVAQQLIPGFPTRRLLRTGPFDNGHYTRAAEGRFTRAR